MANQDTDTRKYDPSPDRKLGLGRPRPWRRLDRADAKTAYVAYKMFPRETDVHSMTIHAEASFRDAKSIGQGDRDAKSAETALLGLETKRQASRSRACWRMLRCLHPVRGVQPMVLLTFVTLIWLFLANFERPVLRCTDAKFWN